MNFLNIFKSSTKKPPQDRADSTAKVTSQNLVYLEANPRVVHADTPGKIYRTCTIDDFIRLKCTYNSPYYMRHDGWTLKQLGQLWAVDNILKYKPKRVLEIGAGVNTFFDDFCHKNGVEYWMCDDVGFLPQDSFEEAVLERKNTIFLRGFFSVNDFDLETDFFDMVFSISTIEHVPGEALDEFFTEIKRVTCKRGHTIHTIDCALSSQILYRSYLRMKKAGYITPDMDVDISWRVDSMLEPLNHIYTYYYGANRDMWGKDRAEVTTHHGCALVDLVPKR